MSSLDLRLIFSPTYSCWNKLHSNLITPCMVAQKDSPWTQRAVCKIANGGKIALIAAAYVICTLATGIFSIATCPHRFYQRGLVEKMGFKSDLKLLSRQETNQIRYRVLRYMDTSVCDIPATKKEEAIQKAIACYARSKKIYGPIAHAWTEYLLEKANKEGKKLVFMARDGIPPYEIALNLMKKPEYQAKYPNITKDKIVLGYFSRKVVNHSLESEANKALFKRYTSEELGIKDGDECLFVDIGFEGSMIDKIRGLLPGVKADFEYLIAINNKATGFIATQDKQLSSVPSAANNLGIHWLEDSHQGCIASPSSLVEVNGRIYPNTNTPKNKTYSSQPKSLQFLLKYFSQLGVVEGETISKDQLEKCKKVFDETIQKIKDSQLPLLIEHDTNKT